MKKIIAVLVILFIVSCNKTMDSWTTEDENNKDVDVYIKTRTPSETSTQPSVFQFFVHNAARGIVTSHSVNTANSPLKLKLLPGDYTGYCTTNASNIEYWDYNESDVPSDIHLISNEWTEDHSLGSQAFTVTKEGVNTATFNLVRKVAMLKVTISNIPENMNDLKINVSNVPTKLSLTGQYSANSTISKSITTPKGDKISETSILLFPPSSEGDATISLSSDNLQFTTSQRSISRILVNHVTELSIKLWTDTEIPVIDITDNNILPWEATALKEDEWEVIVPDSPCTGVGNGTNLIQNSSFEEEFSGLAPQDWVLDATAGNEPTASSVNTPIKTGTKAVMLSPKTYLSQTIDIIGGRCYQFKAHINSQNKDVTWEVSGTWQKGSSPLTSLSDIIRTDEQNLTDGYIDAYNGQVFRAPQEATKLHIEIKNTSDTDVATSLYVDDVSIELVN